MISATGYKILTKIIENDGLASGAMLSENCNLSINTIRNEIGKLNEELKDYDCSIVSHIANGYRLIVSDDKKMQDMIKRYQRYSYLNISENTTIYLMIRELLSTPAYLSIESFMERLYCSRSTIVRLIDKARQYLESYHLKIINKKNYGLQIEGSEWNKRLCLIKMEKIKRHDQNVYPNEDAFDALFLLRTNQRNLIRKIVINYFAQNTSFSLSQIEIPEIYNMAILNQTRKQYLDEEEPILKIEDIPTLEIARDLSQELPEEMKTEWSECEIRILAALIASLAFPNKAYLEENGILDLYLNESKEIVDYIRQYFELPFVFDDQFHEDMASFLFRLEQQLKFNKPNDREYLSSSFNKGIATADICSCIGLWYYEKHQILLSDRMLSLAYYIVNCALVRNREFYEHFNVAVMSRNGLYYSENIAERLKANYRFYFDKITCVNFCQLESYDWSDIDILFSDLFFDLMPSSPPDVITIPFKSIHDEKPFDSFDTYLEQYVRLDALELFPKENLKHSFAQNMEEIYDDLYSICNEEVGDKQRFIKDLQLHERMTGKTRIKGIVSMSTFALRTNEAIFSLILTQKAIRCDDTLSSIFIFYSYGDGSVKNRYLITWLLEHFYNKKEDWLNDLYSKDYHQISEEL